MEFGAPMHKIDEQLAAACDFLSLEANFVLFNTVIIMVFRDINGTLPSQKHFIQRPQGLSLAQLQQTHAVYSNVIHDQISATEGTLRLQAIAAHPDSYQPATRVFFAFLSGFVICPMGFSGSLVDGLAAGMLGAFLMSVQLLRGGDVLFTGIFEWVPLCKTVFETATLRNTLIGLSLPCLPPWPPGYSTALGATYSATVPSLPQVLF